MSHCLLLQWQVTTFPEKECQNCCGGLAGTLVGCLPNNFLAVNAGNKLGELSSFADLYDIKIILLGGSMGVLAVLSVTWKHLAGKQEQRKLAREA